MVLPNNYFPNVSDLGWHSRHSLDPGFLGHGLRLRHGTMQCTHLHIMRVGVDIVLWEASCKTTRSAYQRTTCGCASSAGSSSAVMTFFTFAKFHMTTGWWLGHPSEKNMSQLG